MNIKSALVSAALLFTPLVSVASPSVNDMQQCQGLLDFLDHRLASTPAEYSVSDVVKVRKGLASYNEYIQWEIVSPGLLAFSGGNRTKAQELQNQVDAFKESIVQAYQTRYSGSHLYTDHAVAVNNCAKKAVPSGPALEELKQAVETMVKLARMK